MALKPRSALSLATRIQHSPERAYLLDELLPRLNGLDAEVITDPGGKQRSTWRTHRLCLQSTPADASHLLVVQDDGWPCDDFASAVYAAITERPDRIICLFVSGIGHIQRQVNLARKRRARWLELQATTYIPLVAVVYPAEVARAIPGWAAEKKIPVGRVDDAVVGMFCRAHRLHACATLPSLVQHRDEVPSTMGMPSGHGFAHRVAAWFEESPVLTATATVR